MEDTMLTLIAALLLTPADEPPVAWDDEPPAVRSDGPSYADLYAAAARSGRPLLYWVGQPARDVPGCLSWSCPEFPGPRPPRPPAVVIGLPDGTSLRRGATLPGVPTVDEVRAALGAPAAAPCPWCRP
jgi:hypothetical protein